MQVGFTGRVGVAIFSVRRLPRMRSTYTAPAARTGGRNRFVGHSAPPSFGGDAEARCFRRGADRRADHLFGVSIKVGAAIAHAQTYLDEQWPIAGPTFIG